MAVHISFSSSYLSALESRARQDEESLSSSQRHTADLRKTRVFGSRKERLSPESLCHGDGVAPEIFRGIARARSDAAPTRMAYNLLAEAPRGKRVLLWKGLRDGKWSRLGKGAEGRCGLGHGREGVGGGEGRVAWRPHRKGGSTGQDTS